MIASFLILLGFYTCKRKMSLLKQYKIHLLNKKIWLSACWGVDFNILFLNPERRDFTSIDMGRFSLTFFFAAIRNMNECCTAILIPWYHGIKIMNEPRLLSRQEQSPKKILLAVASLLQFLSLSWPSGSKLLRNGQSSHAKKRHFVLNSLYAIFQLSSLY